MWLWPYLLIAAIVCGFVWVLSRLSARPEFDDARRIDILLGWGGLSTFEREAFGEMRFVIESGHRLGPKEREWVAVVWHRYER